MSSFGEIARAMEEELVEHQKTFPKARGVWHRVCVCGHIERAHADNIGGSTPSREERTSPSGLKTEIFLRSGCSGPPQKRNQEKFEVNGERDGDRKIFTHTFRTTCVCHKFRPVLEAIDPRFRFNQLSPVIPGTRERDYSLVRHPLQVGVRATHTMVRNSKRIQQRWATGTLTDRMLNEIVAEQVDARLRWIEGARKCELLGCRAVDDVFAVFVDTNDLSELRCPEHRKVG